MVVCRLHKPYLKISICHFVHKNTIFETAGVPGTFATKLSVVKGLSRYLWGGMDYMMSPKDERLHFIPAFFFGDGDKLVPQAF